MANATYFAIDTHSEIGEFTLSLDYDDVTLAISDAACVNTTGDVQHVTVGDQSFDVEDGFDGTVDLSTFGLVMHQGPKGIQPPAIIG